MFLLKLSGSLSYGGEEIKGILAATEGCLLGLGNRFASSQMITARSRRTLTLDLEIKFLVLRDSLYRPRAFPICNSSQIQFKLS